MTGVPQDKIFDLLGLPNNEKQAAIERKLDETIALIEDCYPDKPKLNRPTIKYDLKGRTAGQACGGRTIRLNIDLINDPRYYEDMISQTLPHEMTHIACHQYWPKERVAHGYRWQVMMLRIGLNPDRCHQYEVKKARKHLKPHAYDCGCGRGPIMVSNIIHTRIQTGERSYRCNRCGQKLR
jgi:SprT protein